MATRDGVIEERDLAGGDAADGGGAIGDGEDLGGGAQEGLEGEDLGGH